MKINIITNDDWKITESCLAKMEDSDAISITEAEYELLVLQYDTFVKNWKIISQTKWTDAENLQIFITEIKEEEEAAAQTPEA